MLPVSIRAVFFELPTAQRKAISKLISSIGFPSSDYGHDLKRFFYHFDQLFYSKKSPLYIAPPSQWKGIEIFHLFLSAGLSPADFRDAVGEYGKVLSHLYPTILLEIDGNYAFTWEFCHYIGRFYPNARPYLLYELHSFGMRYFSALKHWHFLLCDRKSRPIGKTQANLFRLIESIYARCIEFGEHHLVEIAELQDEIPFDLVVPRRMHPYLEPYLKERSFLRFLEKWNTMHVNPFYPFFLHGVFLLRFQKEQKQIEIQQGVLFDDRPRPIALRHSRIYDFAVVKAGEFLSAEQPQINEPIASPDAL